MKTNLKKKLVSCILAITALFSSGCVHICQFSEKVVDEQYLKSEATCASPTTYYYSCACGKHGKETFTSGKKEGHKYTAEIVDAKYLKDIGNCQDAPEYYKACKWCAKRSSFSTFSYGDPVGCNYTQKIVKEEYLKSEATTTHAEEYYKTCVCGEHGEDFFYYGEKIKESYTAEEKEAYTANALTVTLYDSQNSIYGFTYNTRLKPLRPMIQIQEGTQLTEDYEEYAVSVEEAKCFDVNKKEMTYYVVKAEIPLEVGKTYTYRAWDKYAQVGTEATTIQAKDTKSTSFNFVHISDTQVTMHDDGLSTGRYLKQVLPQIVDTNDFIVHTGDMVQEGRYEYWKEMLDENFTQLSTIPMMAVVGNHEMYVGDRNENYEHFNNSIPEQSTDLGYYYSFVYGNTKFIMLNTMDGETFELTEDQWISDAQYEWLVNELENNTCTWTIVGMHITMYAAGHWSSNPAENEKSLKLRAQLTDLFADYGVDIVLQGHEHIVSRSRPINGIVNGVPQMQQTETTQVENGVEYSINPNGTIYVINGHCGNHSNAVWDKTSDWFTYRDALTPASWAEFEIDGNKLTMNLNYYDEVEGKKNYTSWGIIKN